MSGFSFPKIVRDEASDIMNKYIEAEMEQKLRIQEAKISCLLNRGDLFELTEKQAYHYVNYPIDISVEIELIAEKVLDGYELLYHRYPNFPSEKQLLDKLSCAAGGNIQSSNGGGPGCCSSFSSTSSPSTCSPAPAGYKTGPQTGSFGCTCDIMLLMARGCQCGQIQRERNLLAEEAESESESIMSCH